MGGWRQRALQHGEVRRKGCGTWWLWALLAENRHFREQKEAVWKIAEDGYEKLS